MKEITGDQEDRIYRIKQFIQELEEVQKSYFKELLEYMKYDEDSEYDMSLFDYIYNHSEEETFEEYLDRYN